jgi:hypothetical protein
VLRGLDAGYSSVVPVVFSTQRRTRISRGGTLNLVLARAGGCCLPWRRDHRGRAPPCRWLHTMTSAAAAVSRTTEAQTTDDLRASHHETRGSAIRCRKPHRPAPARPLRACRQASLFVLVQIQHNLEICENY